jgi:hypothetical protein
MAGDRPQLEVLGTIVVSNAVPMMNRFTIEQVPPKQILSHEKVLEDVKTSRGSRMVRSADHDVSHLVPRSTALPVAIRLSGNAPAVATGRRLQLLGTAEAAARRTKDVLAFSASTALHLTKVTTGCHRVIG